MSCDALALRRRCACLLALLSVAIVGAAARADDEMPGPIETGLVVIDGQIVDRPYAVAADEMDVTVNGLSVGHVASTAASGSPFEESPANAAVAQIERLLLQDGLLLRHHDTVLLLPGISGVDGGTLLTDIMRSVTSDQSPREILQSLAWYDDAAIRHMTTRRWLELITLFQSDKALCQQITDYCGIIPDDPLDAVAMNSEIDAEEVGILAEIATEDGDISESVQYGVNLFGMLAGVAALGSLLSSRPNTDRRWRDLDASAASLKLVTRCGGLIVLLGLFDLVCTLMAFHTGMFRELNPVASQFGSSPLMIIAFKVFAMTAGVGLLWRLRQYSGAQTAAWWMCLVCTLVVFRWLTFHSMFIA